MSFYATTMVLWLVVINLMTFAYVAGRSDRGR